MKLTKRSARLFVLLVAAVFSAFGLCGCSGGGGSSSDGGGGGGGSPEIALSTNQIVFGNVVANAAGLRSADRSVVVQNTGTANLQIGQVAQANPLVAPFSIQDDNCSGVSLAPNASCTVLVRFAPTTPSATSFTDSFNIPSNDADEPSLTVSVSGVGKGLNVTINKVDTSGHPNIRMVVSVTDGDNNAVPNLPQGAFAVSEGSNGMLITAFDNTVITPVSVALDLDYSTSITPVQDDVEESAKLFLTNLTNAGDRAAVIKFASQVRVAIDFTPVVGNLPLFNAAIDAAYPDSTTGTKLYEAVNDSVNRLDLDPLANDRLAVLVVVDGYNNDPAGVLDLDDVIANAQDKKVFIFAIGLVGKDGLNTEVMQRMAVETGGQYFEAPTSAQLNAIYNQISQILTNQYEITFNTTRAVGTSNTLKVVATQGALDGEDTETVIY